VVTLIVGLTAAVFAIAYRRHLARQDEEMDDEDFD
jgi:hypothetical protein